MLGELVAESTGQITSTRVMPLSPLGEIRMESSFVGHGRMLGIEINDVGTFVQTLRADGILYVDEGNVIMTGPNGEAAQLTGFALGRPAGPGPSAHFASCGVLRTTAQHWKRLNAVALVSEYDVDSQGHFTARCWEWK